MSSVPTNDDPLDEMTVIWEACADKAANFGWESLSDIERVVVLAMQYWGTVAVVQVPGFYFDQAGDRAVETVWALEQLGAHNAAKVIRECNALFPGGAPPTDGTARASQAQRLLDARRFPRSGFQQSGFNGEVFSALESFIEMHKVTLQASGHLDGSSRANPNEGGPDDDEF